MKGNVSRTVVLGLIVFLVVCGFAILKGWSAAKTPFQVLYLGHSAFEIVSSGGTRLLIDPFLRQNPTTPAAFKDTSRYRPNAILVTHSHFDHTGEAVEIAKQSGAPIISEFTWVTGLPLPEQQKKDIHTGGKIAIGDVTIHAVPAIHSSSPGGRPLGFVLTFADGRSLYHTGDTGIFGDMALIQELYHPNVILIDVGGGSHGQDPKTAALAIKKYFQPDVVVPIHFASLPGLVTAAEVRSAFAGDRRFRMMAPGQTRAF